MKTSVPAGTRPSNSLVAAAQGTGALANSRFENDIMSDQIQELMKTTLPDDRTRTKFLSNLVAVVAQSDELQKCDTKSIVSAALQGTSKGLIINHGFYVVPYGKIATFIMGYKGFIALAMASGYYADLDCVEVREGEFTGRSIRTGKPIMDFTIYESEEERNQHPITGYYAYFELKDGFFRGEYWTIDDILAWGKRYSNVDVERWKRIRAGEEKTPSGSKPWYDVDKDGFGNGFVKMAMKTPLRNLLNSGYAPLSDEMRRAIDDDLAEFTVPNLEPEKKTLVQAAKARKSLKEQAIPVIAEEDVEEPDEAPQEVEEAIPEPVAVPQGKTVKGRTPRQKPGQQMTIEAFEQGV